MQIQRELDAAVADDPDFAPARPVPDSPVLRQPLEPAGKVFVDHPEAAELLDFACATLWLRLRFLVQSFDRSGERVGREQTALMGAAIELMHVLGATSTALTRLPASDAASGVHAGMTSECCAVSSRGCRAQSSGACCTSGSTRVVGGAARCPEPCARRGGACGGADRDARTAVNGQCEASLWGPTLCTTCQTGRCSAAVGRRSR
jgi:hypothetical protein